MRAAALQKYSFAEILHFVKFFAFFCFRLEFALQNLCASNLQLRVRVSHHMHMHVFKSNAHFSV